MADLDAIKERYALAARVGHPHIRDSWQDVPALLFGVEKLSGRIGNATVAVQNGESEEIVLGMLSGRLKWQGSEAVEASMHSSTEE
jgi:hypothetical protein